MGGSFYSRATGTPDDASVTDAKVAADAAIAPTKIDGTALTQDDLEVTAAGNVIATGSVLGTDGVATKSADTTGLSTAQIDALFTTTPVSGQILVDPTQARVLVRKASKWAYVAVGNEIA